MKKILFRNIYKYCILLVFVLSAFACKKDEDNDNPVSDLTPKNFDSYMDPRDSNVYKTIDINGFIWFAENFRYKCKDSWNYLNDTNIAKVYGRLYTQKAALDAAPPGWHLPTRAEWDTLAEYLGGWEAAGGRLKEYGTSHWRNKNVEGSNSSGFTALPGGERDPNGNYYYLGDVGNYWSATLVEKDNFQAYYYEISGNSAYLDEKFANRVNGFSVRYVKNK